LLQNNGPGAENSALFTGTTGSLTDILDSNGGLGVLCEFGMFCFGVFKNISLFLLTNEIKLQTTPLQ
jgi:hypothetical protein